jgi:hypothetical protein
VICIRFGDDNKAKESFEPTALILEEEAVPPAKDED